MSQPYSNPPPLPVVPLPVESIEPEFHRPAVVTFIGTASVIIAALGMLAGFVFGFVDMGLMLVSTTAKTLAAMPRTTVSSAVVATGGTSERIAIDGLAAAERQRIANGLSRAITLSPNQLMQLDELLAEHGKSIVPGASSFTAEQLAATVAKTGHRSYTGSTGSDYFVLGNGQLELSADRASFFPTGGLPAIRSNAIQIPAGNSPTSASLQPDQIRSVIRTVEDLNGAKIKSVQMTALIHVLNAPAEQLVIPTTDGTDPAWEVTTASTNQLGTLAVSFQQGTMFSAFNCDSSGNMGTSSISSNAVSGVIAGRNFRPSAFTRRMWHFG